MKIRLFCHYMLLPDAIVNLLGISNLNNQSSPRDLGAGHLKNNYVASRLHNATLLNHHNVFKVIHRYFIWSFLCTVRLYYPFIQLRKPRFTTLYNLLKVILLVKHRLRIQIWPTWLKCTSSSTLNKKPILHALT